MSYTITIFTKGCGSNDGDFSGKLRFVHCTDIKLADSGKVSFLYFTYRTKQGKGNEAKATFKLTNVYGYTTEKE